VAHNIVNRCQMICDAHEPTILACFAFVSVGAYYGLRSSHIQNGYDSIGPIGLTSIVSL